jgi:hypothetical protein
MSYGFSFLLLMHDQMSERCTSCIASGLQVWPDWMYRVAIRVPSWSFLDE